MLLLFIFAFIAGIVTILSPCILPVLPIILSGSITGDKKRPIGIIVGFILSFTFFTLFLSTLVKITGIPSDALRTISIMVITLFGISLLIPNVQLVLEQLMSKLSNSSTKNNNKSGFKGGILIGLSLGLLWAPCVGPILASVITLAATNQVNFATFFITFAYSLGTSIPMIAIMYGGRDLLNRLPVITKHTETIQKGFGVLMILIAIAIFFNFDRAFQTFILEKFPSYGVGLTKIEDNNQVKNALNKLRGNGELSNSNEPQSQAAPNPTFAGNTKWLNLPDEQQSLSLEQLKGKVVLIDFWTYTCINCIRTLPFVTQWYDKYKEKGFVVIGVHTPEFEFEKKTENVMKAIKDYKIHYPVVQDNNYDIWNSYNNQYWPAEYLIDAHGIVRHTHFGEGQYDETERMIQQLLEEAGQQVKTGTIHLEFGTPGVRSTPETYLGSARMERNLNTNIKAGITSYTLYDNLLRDYFSLGGQWDIQSEKAVSGERAELNFQFNAGKVFLVITPQNNSEITVYLDGKIIPTAYQGADVVNGKVKLDSERLYNLVDMKGEQNGDNILDLKVTGAGTGFYAFTFGP